MQIDTNYLKEILHIFIESDTNFITTDRFKTMISEDIEKFLFHWDLLLDKHLIVNTKGEKPKIATYGLNGNCSLILGANVRLHDNGHEFYNMLKDDTAINKIQTNVKNLSMDFLLEASKQYINYKIGNLFNS